MLPNQSALPRGRGLYEGWGRWGAQRREGKWFGHQKVKVSFSHMTWEQSKREEKALIEPLVCHLPPTSTFLLREAMATHTPKIKHIWRPRTPPGQEVLLLDVLLTLTPAHRCRCMPELELRRKRHAGKISQTFSK